MSRAKELLEMIEGIEKDFYEGKLKVKVSFVNPNFYLEFNNKSYLLGEDLPSATQIAREIGLVSKFGNADQTLVAAQEQGEIDAEVDLVAFRKANLKEV